jgi:hypothetical protein
MTRTFESHTALGLESNPTPILTLLFKVTKQARFGLLPKGA